jgi:hypothetical protein
MQLDIFDHSRDVMLRNDVMHALQRRDAAGARAAWQALADEFPHDDALGPLAVLIDALESQAASTPFRDQDALRRAREVIDGQIAPAAQRLLGDAAAAWLAPLWRHAAQRAAGLPFHPDHVDDHAAALWVRAEDWPTAAQAVAGIESWRRIPAPLSWMAHARCCMHGLDDAWPLLTELAWLSPARFDALARRLADPPLDRLRKQFDTGFEGRGDASDLAWFPAWVLTQKAGLARLLSQAQPQRHDEPERAMRLLVEIVGLERQGRHHELIDKRKSLRDLHLGLYAAYMASR